MIAKGKFYAMLVLQSRVLLLLMIVSMQAGFAQEGADQASLKIHFSPHIQKQVM